MSYWRGKRAVITGGSSGLGRVIAEVLVDQGAHVAIVARRQAQLDETAHALRTPGDTILTVAADVTQPGEVKALAATIQREWGGVDFVCNCAGRSMRGTLLGTTPDDFRALWEANFLSALLCAQEFAPALTESRGHLALIGSLASKVASSYLGAYPTAKFPLAALAQQLRLELNDAFHVLLACPGPIARADSSTSEERYAEQAADLPPEARRPGGGARVNAIDPVWLSKKILHACERRQPELIVPAKARLLFALAQLSPRLGDWLIRKMTK